MDYGYLNNITLRTKVLNFFRRIFMLPSLENILVRKTEGKPPAGLITKFIPNHYQYSKGSRRSVERNGVKYDLDISDLVDWYLYYGFKDGSKEAVFGSIKEGMCILDVGANMGDLSFNFAKLVGSTGHVYSFEPDNQNYQRLLKNHALNNFQNITLINKGLGDTPGLYRMSANINEPGNDGSKRIIANADAGDLDSAEIISLDQWMAITQPNKIDMIKMDIEGYEYAALCGAKETISKYKPTLYLELHDVKLKEHGSSAEELLDYVRNLGYKIKDADSNEVYDMERSLDDIHDDIVCSFL